MEQLLPLETPTKPTGIPTIKAGFTPSVFTSSMTLNKAVAAFPMAIIAIVAAAVNALALL